MTPQGPYNPGYPGYPPAPYPPAGAAYEYEFDAAQNAVISSASLWARILGIVFIVVGALSLIGCNVFTFALNLIVGITLLGAASAFSTVVSTQGSDIAYMMQALSKLGTTFKIRVIATLIGLVLLFVVGAVITLLVIASK